MMTRRKQLRVRQWAPLTILAAGLAGAGLGALAGDPNSWLWFAGGAVIPALYAIGVYRRERITRAGHH
jgi:hypothetical protein